MVNVEFYFEETQAWPDGCGTWVFRGDGEGVSEDGDGSRRGLMVPQGSWAQRPGMCVSLAFPLCLCSWCGRVSMAWGVPGLPHVRQDEWSQAQYLVSALLAAGGHAVGGCWPRVSPLG